MSGSTMVRSMHDATRPEAVERFLAAGREHFRATTSLIRLEDVEGWVADPAVDAIRHQDGAFFSIVGVRVTGDDMQWDQPIIDQPEIGVLGIAVRDQDGITQCLMQAKAEPGTVGGVQLGPTVQATRSNYTRRHGGKAIPYLSHFLEPGSVVQGFDIAQSEQGARFLGKHNRNMTVFVGDDVAAEYGYEWFSLGELHRALRAGDTINFDARTVLAGLSALEAAHLMQHAGHDDLTRLLARSLQPQSVPRWELGALLTWLRAARRKPLSVQRIPLQHLEGWSRRDGRIEHEDGAFFSVVGARVVAQGREVSRWCQPLIVEHSTALLGLAVSIIDGVAHVLLHAKREPGLATGVELGPTVQIVPDTYTRLPELHQPASLELVLSAAGDAILYDTVLSGEGGRFHEARQRHLIVLVDPVDEPPEHRWVALHQLAELLRRGGVVNEQARSLFACLVSVLTPRLPGES